MSYERTTELLPCPFCGGEANVIDHHNDDGSVSVGCDNDTCLGFSGLGWLYKTEAEAIAAWNTRAELGSGTCELEPLSALDVTLNMLDNIEWGACSECRCAVPMDAKFCNECGKRVSA